MKRIMTLQPRQHKMVRLLGVWVLLSGVAGYAAEERASGCDECTKPVLLSGAFQHYKVADGSIQGTQTPELFREEVFGPAFEVSIPGLEAGAYTVEFEFAEVFFKKAGGRVFDITRGDLVVAGDVDIVKAAGGPGKLLAVSTVAEHPGDAVGGPLTFTFTAKRDEAKMNVVRVMAASGKVLSLVSARDFVSRGDAAAVKIPEIGGPVLYTDPDQPLQVRINDLVGRMSLAEKAPQMRFNAPAIPRLDVPAYDYWNECLHGVARSGIATVFPQAIGLAAMWNESFHREVADIISTEARAKYHEALRKNAVQQYYGLTFWTPNINIFRDPRWGRGQETYGEDPFLTARLGIAFIKGLQGTDPHYLKAMACAKHYAVHSGPEPDRHHFDAVVSTQDLYDTYLPQFEAAVREGGVMSVMGAYNRVNGEPACSSRFLLEDILRVQWGFKGHVVSDCGAIHDIYANHKTVATPEEAAARAVLAGCDLACDGTYNALPAAVFKGLITSEQIDVALRRVLEVRFRLGMFDPQARVPFASIPFSANDSRAHQAAALRAAAESIVLLKNSGILPLDAATLKRIAVIGANADDVDMMYGNYNGFASQPVSLLKGIRAAVPGAVVTYEKGVPLALPKGQAVNANDPAFLKAVDAAKVADIVIYAGGISPRLEGEEMQVPFDGFSGGDRTLIELPSCQTALLKALHATGKPVIFVNFSGSAIAMPWEAETLPAILQAWYPGQAGGTALAGLLFGSLNPAGRLPVTFYQSTADLPDFSDYSMKNRTYRFFTGKPLFPFGHGLSYSTFQYGPLTLDRKSVGVSDILQLTVPVSNTGKRDGDEVVQVYYRPMMAAPSGLRQALCGFKRVTVPNGKTVQVTIPVPVSQFRRWDAERNGYWVAPGDYELRVGTSSGDIRREQVISVIAVAVPAQAKMKGYY